jgi:F-type H+-transporting ATPase subunit delta
LIDLTVSRRYAKALLSLGKEDGKYAEYGEELRGFAQLVGQEPDLRNALLNPIYGMEERRKVLVQVLELLQISPLVSNFIKLLFDKHRLNAVAGISQSYQELVDALENVSRAQVTAAIPLDEAVQGRLRQTLEKLTGTKVIMNVQEDPAILGGIVARVGDLVFDGSVRTQLTTLKESLMRGEV